MENSCIKLDNNALNWSNTSVSKNLSGEKDFREIDKEIKKTLEAKSFTENQNLSKSDHSINGQQVSSNFVIKNSIWNNEKEKKEENNHFNMKFLNYNNKYLLNQNLNDDRFHEGKSSSKKEMRRVDWKSFHENSNLSKFLQENVEGSEEEPNINYNQLNYKKNIHHNNLFLINQSNCQKYVTPNPIRAMTEPSNERSLFPISRNLFPSENQIPNTNQGKIFPEIQSHRSGKYEDSFDFSVNEDPNNELFVKKISHLSINSTPQFLNNNKTISSSFISTNESLENEDSARKYLTPKNISNNNAERNWGYSQNKLNFNNLNFYNCVPPQSQNIENINCGKASSFCNPSDTRINEMYYQPHLTDNMFSPNVEKISVERKKTKKKEEDENQNVIFLENIISCKDRRTTLMIKNIPNKYDTIALLDEIDCEFKGKYDFFYLPLDYNNNCNLGFAFINFVDPLHILLFYELFCDKKWKRFKSVKICKLSYAKFQGKKELTTHFEKNNGLSTNGDTKKPLIFQTPNPLPKVKFPMKYHEILKDMFPKCQLEYDRDKIIINSFFRK